MFKGKTAVITGASRGIGRACALKLAEKGANIAVIYAGNEEKAREVCSEAESFGVRALPFCCDVASYETVKTTVGEIKAQLGTIDILVNNAGVTKDKLLAMMKEDDFDRVVDTNLKGAFNMIRHCCPIFMKQRSGRIINVSSVAGLMGNAGQVNYSASKAGIVGLTKSVARELASRGVCCNAIAPGFIETDMTAALGDASEQLMKMIPLARPGKAEEVAALVAFLASDEASYITGEVIRIDGGMAM